ncbi:MAG: hypothetical protein ACI9MC_001549 [Kiritimatiellia bacterium]|jgi:hypothetical protein
MSAAVGFAALWAPMVSRAEPVRHALIVGVNDGGGVLDPLRYAERDAERFARVLTDLGGFEEERVTVIYQPDAWLLQQALAHHAALSAAHEDDLFVFYYSGHADARGLRLGQDLYHYETLRHDMGQVDASARVGVLDACRSGSIIRFKGARVSESIFGQQERLAASGEVWMTATSADELAQESEALRGGFFTHYLISGMRGAADTGDGLVDVNELYRYTFDRVVARTGTTTAGVQHPHFDVNLAGSAGLSLTDVRQSASVLVLSAKDQGHIAVLRMADRTQLAELQSDGSREIALALSPGRYLVRRRTLDGTLYEAQVHILPQQDATVTSWKSVTTEHSVSRGSVEERYLVASRRFEERLNLKQNPVVAGLSSGLVPGAGQIYNRQYLKGGVFFGATALLVGGVTIFSAKRDDVPNASGAAIGLALWGASIADGVYNVHRNEQVRPRTGGAIGWSTGFGVDGRAHTGLMVELNPIKHVSIGLDRTGWSRLSDGWDLHLGSRLLGTIDLERWRLGAFLSYGVRGGERVGQGFTVRGVIGTGLSVRYYTTPRYFIEIDQRVEADGGELSPVVGIAMGVHLGR